MAALRRKLFEYGVSLVAVALALLVRWFLTSALGYNIPFATVIGAVAVAVGVGGLWPAVLVTAIGYVGGRLLFVPPTGTLAFHGPADWVLLAGYLFSSFAVIFFGVLMRRATRRYRGIAAELAARNQQKDELLATVAHEIRGPLAPIRSAVEVMRAENAAPHDVHRAREVIDRQLDHLAQLIDDLSDAGRIGRRQLELHRTNVALRDVLEGAVDAVRPIFLGRKQAVALEIPADPLWLDADARRLEQVFVNLLTNASKFSPRHGHIEIKAVALQRQVEVRVADGGAGIAPDALPHIFELFYRGGHDERGLGIGLALVRQLVQLHGGSVIAQSEGLGKGSAFVVRLPLPPDQRARTEAARQGRVEVVRG
jgi:signal transduction histidine kinase